LVGQKRQATQSIREADSRGRHTTTHRELFILPTGGMVIDTPGLREIQLWGTGDELSGVFTDIDSLAQSCKFNDCTHASEPGCSVLEAIELGMIDIKRLESYQKLQKELQYLDTKVNENAALAKRQNDRKFGKYYKQVVEGMQKIKNQ
jgi:ribosome biogenesis GTPase